MEQNKYRFGYAVNDRCRAVLITGSNDVLSYGFTDLLSCCRAVVSLCSYMALCHCVANGLLKRIRDVPQLYIPVGSFVWNNQYSLI